MTCLVVLMSSINIAGFPPPTRIQNNAISRLMVFEDCHGRRGRRAWAGIALSAACEIIMNGRHGAVLPAEILCFHSWREREGYLRMLHFFDEQRW